MKNVHPAWWPWAEQEIHASVKGFVEKIRIKLGDNPRLIVERENPFLFRIRSVGDPRAPASMIVDAFLSCNFGINIAC